MVPFGIIFPAKIGDGVSENAAPEHISNVISCIIGLGFTVIETLKAIPGQIPKEGKTE